MDKIEKKKWMFVLTPEQYNWIKETSTEAGVQGVVVVRELINKAMADKSGRLKNDLAEAQTKAELQEINNRIAALEEQRQHVSKQLRRDKVLA